MAKLFRWTVDQVEELEGGPPEAIAITRPANWGPFKTDLLEQAVRLADLSDTVTLTEPEAAAIYYASRERVALGSVIAVYDLGGGTFDAAVLRKTRAGWSILGTPEGIERLGGIDFDEAVFGHVRRIVPEAFAALDLADNATLTSVGLIRRQCVEAKEALSSDIDASIPVLLGDVHTAVRLTRSEFEEMIRPTLHETIGAMRRALRSADVQPADVTAVLLVGGSSRIPLIAELVGAEFGRPVAVDAHPKHAVALGAVLAAAGAGEDATIDQGSGGPDGPQRREPPRVVVAMRQLAALPRAWALVSVFAVLALALGAGAFIAAGDDGDDGDGAGNGETASASPSITASPSPSPTPSPTPTITTSASPTLPSARITDVSLQNGRFIIEYEPGDFVPVKQTSDPDVLHVHFFWDTLDAVNAGGNGPSPGSWLLWDEPFTVSHSDFDVANRPDGASGICVIVADYRHNVADVDGDGQTDLDTGNCVDLPDS